MLMSALRMLRTRRLAVKPETGKKFGLPHFGFRRVCAIPLIVLCFAISFPTSPAAQTTTTSNHTTHNSTADRYYDPLPQETGDNGLQLALRKLQTTGRLMQIDAHPDDEDGGMLTLEARGKGVSTLLMTLNRGEGGQNELGSNLFDVLGIVRTLEVLAADRYYGIEQRFSRVADFGYSKTPEETFQKWGGHDIALADIVRVIRTFHPDVLIARFSGTDRDGHGHHQASAILTKEAFRAAADPNKFPEQIKEGLEPWQPKKLYIGNVCGFGSSTCDAANYTVKLNTGKEDPLLGDSYVGFAIQGLRHQRSQALGGVQVPKGDRFAYYKLVDSIVDSTKDKDGHEQDFFDGIDTSLPGLVSQLGDEEKNVPWLRSALNDIEQRASEAQKNAAVGSAAVITALLNARKTADGALKELGGSSVSEPSKRWLVAELQTKRKQLQHAANLALGVQLKAWLDAAPAASPDSAAMAIPGKNVSINSSGHVPDGIVTSEKLIIDTPGCLPQSVLGLSVPEGIRGLGREGFNFQATVCDKAVATRPYWHRLDPERDSVNTIDQPQFQTLPFPPPPFWVLMEYEYKGVPGSIEVPVMVRFQWPGGTEGEHPLAIGPAFSIAVSPSSAVIPTDLHGDTTLNTSVQDQGGSEAQVALKVPDGWHAEPPRETLQIAEDGSKDATFRVEPAGLKEGYQHIWADLTSADRQYREGYTVITREDLGTAYYYQPAVQRISVVDVKVCPKDFKVAYIMGAGDEIPTVLRQIGVNLTLIPPDKIATEDLSHYQTIILGIRAYDTQKDVIANNQRLLDYVKQGGRLVVQYNTMGSFGVPIDFNAGKYTPYPATLSRARVSVEEAPITILDSANPIFHTPNEITQRDFDGWVQERGLYFMSQWGPEFTPLLETHDPGEAEQKGGLLIAHYGKGTYIYTGLAFFRQLPAGVPGAVRLFVNLIASR
jgi:LmbE family N-acetylglucosaminyl deacetylase